MARLTSLQAIAIVGWPTRSTEDWKYTPTKVLRETGFVVESTVVEPVSKPDEVAWGANGCMQLVFLNGRLHREWSHWWAEEGLVITDINEANSPLLHGSGDPFESINLAFVQDGFHISLADDITLEAPIHLLFIGQATDRPICSHPRVVLSVGRNSRATLIQTHVGLGEAPSWINSVVRVRVGENADVVHHIIHEGRENLHYIGQLDVDVARDAAYHSHTFWFGGALTRNTLNVSLNDTGASTDLYGLYLCGGNDLVDNHTTVDHKEPNGRSNEVYKGILTGTSKAVFNGKIVVHEDAQKTDSSQSNRTMLLSEGATINTKPELQIFADDVSCAHGTTVGQIDKEGLFYLRSRGISSQEATVMLTAAFCDSLLEVIDDGPIQQRLRSLVETRLSALTAEIR